MPIHLKQDAGKGGGGKLPPGEHDVEIVRVFTTGQDGAPLRTKTGQDRKIKVVFQEPATGLEIWYDAILEGLAIWKIARLLSHAGLHEEELAQEGITEYTHFADQKTADRILVGKRVHITVLKKRMNDGETRFEADVSGPDMGGIEANPGPESISDAGRIGAGGREDIPF